MNEPKPLVPSSDDEALALSRAMLAFETSQALRDSQARYEARLRKKVVRLLRLALRLVGRQMLRKLS